VGVGIGRPVSREPNDVAKYVLKKMTPVERQKVEGAAEDVLNKLMAIKR
jgi:PTH1 family peptidyl-tRNA hydrolase